MRTFTVALGVQCTHCHAGTPPQLNYPSDEKPTKDVARKMIHMVMHINDEHLKGIGSATPAEPRAAGAPPALGHAAGEGDVLHVPSRRAQTRHGARRPAAAIDRDRERLMSVMRKALLWASTNVWLRERAMRTKFVRRSVVKFMPGERIEDAIEAAKELKPQGSRPSSRGSART